MAFSAAAALSSGKGKSYSNQQLVVTAKPRQIGSYVALYNSQLPQSALASRTPLQAMKDWHKLRPELFRKQPYYVTGCDKQPFSVRLVFQPVCFG